MTASKRFDAYTERLAAALGHADRETPFRQYTTGLLLPLERKSIEPIAARVDPAQVSAAHQSLHHFVAKSDWSDRALLATVQRQLLPVIERHGPIEAWIVDDTGFPKKGKHSVGVARQYCGQLGKQDNCQVAVSLSVANEAASLPIDYRLYLPKDWAGDPARRAKAGVPEAIDFKTKPAIALDQIRQAVADGVPQGVVLADAGYGADMKFQAALLELELTYVPVCRRAAPKSRHGGPDLRPVGLQAGMFSAFSQTARSGPTAKNRCQPRPGRVRDGRPHVCSVPTTISRFPPKSWLCRCRHPTGRASLGAPALRAISRRASPQSACARRIAITTAASPGRNFGF